MTPDTRPISMPGTPQLQVVQLTPPGRGAVATLLVEGPGAWETVRSQFPARSGRPLKSRPNDQLTMGRYGSGAGEEVVVRRRSDRSVELHCHGGHAAVAMIEKTLVELGCRVVAWRDWVTDHHEDPIAAAAQIALAEARTQRTAAILLDQYHGGDAAQWKRSKKPFAKRTWNLRANRSKPCWPAPSWAGTWCGHGGWCWPVEGTWARAA